MNDTRRNRARRGFSLLELMLVLVILGLLTATAAVVVLPQAEKAKVRTTKQTLNTIKGAIDQYQMEQSGLPPTLEPLYGPYLEETKGRQDGWKNDIIYFVRQDATGTARPFELMSLGKDGVEGTEDDISYWTMNDEE